MKVFQYFIGIGALVGAVVAIVQVYEFYKEIKGDISNLQTSLEELEGVEDEIRILQENLEQMKMASQQVSDLEVRLGNIQLKIPEIAEEIATNSELAIARTNEEVSALKSKFQDLSKASGAGVTVLDYECVPLGKRVRLEEHNSVQFCETELVVSIGEIRLSDNVVRTAHSLQTVPGKSGQNTRNCMVNFMAINRDNPDKPTVDLVAVCKSAN